MNRGHHHHVRVRCLHGPEVIINIPVLSHLLKVADLKSRVLCQLAKDQSDEQTNEECEVFLLFRGQIMADVDVINLFTMNDSDFFVLVQEKIANTNKMVTTSSRTGLKRKRKMTTSVDANAKQQLIDMGFTCDQANVALIESNNDVTQAIAYLMGEIPSETNQSIEQLLKEPMIHQLHTLVQQDPFQAVRFVQESIPRSWQSDLTSHPVATLEFLTGTLPSQVPDISQEQGAIKRLIAMGFESTLVKTIYESCQDEEVAIHLLLETSS